MNDKRMYLILAALTAIIALVYWPWRSAPGFTAPAAMTAEQIASCPDNQLVSTVTTDLRFKLATDERNLARWRSLPEAARNVLALSWVMSDVPPGAPTPTFQGFATVIANKAPNSATLTEIAQACEAIGGKKLAEAVRDAATIAESAAGKEAARASGNEIHRPYVEVDGRFREAVQREEALKLLRLYIRAHADEIATAHF